MTPKGPSINDVSSEGEGGEVKNQRFYLVKRRLRGREGGHKIEKMGRRRLRMASNPLVPKQIFIASLDDNC